MSDGEMIDLSEERVHKTEDIITHFVKVPRELKELRDGIGYALHGLAFGLAQPIETMTSDLISVEFRLTPRAQKYLDELLAQPDFQNNKRKVFHSALTWLSQQPPHTRMVKIY